MLSRLAVCCFVLLLCAGLLSCAGLDSGRGAGAETGWQATAGSPAVFFSYSPAQLVAQRQAAGYPNSARSRKGKDWNSALPNQSVSVSNDSAFFDPIARSGFSAAYCIYSFEFPSYIDRPELHLEWQTAPDEYFVGLVNFDRQRWDWFSSPAGADIQIPEDEARRQLEPYRDPDSGAVLTVILVPEGNSGVLTSLRLGEPGWIHTWGGPFNQPEYYDSFHDLVVDSEGNVYVSCWSDNIASTNDLIDRAVVILKYSAAGELLKQTAFDNGAFYRPQLAMSADGGLCCMAADVGFGNISIWKLDSNGELAWKHSFAFDVLHDIHSYDLECSASGDVYAVGVAEGLGGSDSGGLLIKFEPDGVLTYAKLLGPGTGFAYGISLGLALDASQVYVCGEPTLMCFDLGGELEWQYDLDQGAKQGRQVTVGSDGNIHVVAEGLSNLQLCGFTPSGSLLYCSLLPASSLDEAQDLKAIDDGLSLLCSNGWLMSFNLSGDLLKHQSLQVADYEVFLGRHWFDAEGNLYLCGGIHSEGWIRPVWSNNEVSFTASAAQAVPTAYTVEDAEGALIELDFTVTQVEGIEDQLNPGEVGDYAGWILKRERQP
jgi:hypothetical protein